MNSSHRLSCRYPLGHPIGVAMSLRRLILLCCVSLGLLGLGTHAYAEDAPAAAGAAPHAKSGPKRTFEGQEPLFYIDSKRRPYIEPFQKTDAEEYFICRGTVGEWFRKLIAEEATQLAEKDKLAPVTGSTCALRLVATHSGKKLPILSVELYVSTDIMRACILGQYCPQSRTGIIYVRDTTLYRSYIISDQKKRIMREYCLDNKSNILATKSCWEHFDRPSSDELEESDKDSKKKSKSDSGHKEKSSH